MILQAVVHNGDKAMKKSAALVVLLLALLTLHSGQVPETSPAPESADLPETEVAEPEEGAEPTDNMTAADVEAFLDGMLPAQLERENIAGATVSIVKDGELLFAKGYGFADVKSGKPVVAEETLFRPGSISKLFTWTAVMQIHEQGKIDLNRDVNDYLDFRIPEAFGKPITMKDILTHTPGFEESVKDLFKTEAVELDLGGYLKTHIPSRIFPPATVPAYSNYATALAGYVVERVSGQPFNDYVKTNIFDPLEMSSSTFAQPLPEDLAKRMSTGYRLASDEEPVKFEIVVPFPAGSLTSSSTDIAKFMLAHLNGGAVGERSILKPETTKLMHSRLFALDENANGMAHGFYEESRNGLRIIGHGGDTIAFHSDLHLIPEKNVGFFISYNSGGKGEVSGRTIVWEGFLDRYFPYEQEDVSPPDSAEADAQAVAGKYMVSRRSEHSFLRVAAVLGEAGVSPTGEGDGTIFIDAFTEPSGAPKRFKAVAPMTFRDVNGKDTIIFKPDAEGRMQMIIQYPFMVFKRVGFFENSGVLLPVLGISLGLMALTLILAPIAWIVRRRYGYKLEYTTMQNWLRRGVWVVFALDLILVIGLVSLVTYALSNIDFLSDEGNVWFHLVQILGVLGALGTIAVIVNAVYCWMIECSIWYRLRAALFVICCFGFLWFAYVSNLLVISSTY
ncbi:MAG: class A beta-lactamase-related serine hydrolase [Acidobacteria bacterium]|nr:MAG: class A beta-lactamase-related serine hydrolase [Acidobacteriota bacterium]REK01655.1 MAG: class A beta-lactamase-related serine hydrolase [Acidobacteriota bacterium]REK14611.1 MAG: class A beta-lactamase-related serine hydrolase [Acidobacteriota bacterium]REK45326.1 MAG: class A beta-lactamase-related serine hydrolase [Acidobacteriota bacterium]